MLIISLLVLNQAARAQGGSGEIFRALSQSSITSKLNRMGIRSIDCHIADDNLLARTCDPTFIGYCHSIGLDCAAKVVDPDAEQMSMYGYCHAAGVLRSDGEVEIGPVSERMPSMVPCTGQYYLDMSWVNKVTSALLKDPLALYHLAPAALPPPAHKNHGATGYKFTRHLTDFLLPYSRGRKSTTNEAIMTGMNFCSDLILILFQCLCLQLSHPLLPWPITIVAWSLLRLQMSSPWCGARLLFSPPIPPLLLLKIYFSFTPSESL